ncbi:hypothetical protein L873DRAFT_1165525 [Choiromyces venosus 120613-1]|uniref:Uncharacterized protein n=1 Tax=Choiromyces venosus 120613-1 TaxID=1336337 RepID=A0A3N4JFG4_9PEZI|nr:hypothetical protein L873DRAFT_1165525 [Choiromyces venosus 120613-1]
MSLPLLILLQILLAHINLNRQTYFLAVLLAPVLVPLALAGTGISLVVTLTALLTMVLLLVLVLLVGVLLAFVLAVGYVIVVTGEGLKERFEMVGGGS